MTTFIFIDRATDSKGVMHDIFECSNCGKLVNCESGKMIEQLPDRCPSCGEYTYDREEQEEETMDKVQIHKEICEKMHTTYKAKNADYGDSFAKLRKEYPNAILIRLSDKLNRLKTLMQGEDQMVKDESIDDTLLDLANYCVMEIVERRWDNEEMERDFMELDKKFEEIGRKHKEKSDMYINPAIY